MEVFGLQSCVIRIMQTGMVPLVFISVLLCCGTSTVLLWLRDEQYRGVLQLSHHRVADTTPVLGATEELHTGR